MFLTGANQPVALTDKEGALGLAVPGPFNATGSTQAAGQENGTHEAPADDKQGLLSGLQSSNSRQ